MDGWKVTAIIFIILFTLETILLGWMINEGTEMISRESECSINICGKIEESVSYYYDTYTDICYCFNGIEEVIKETYLNYDIQ